MFEANCSRQISASLSVCFSLSFWPMSVQHEACFPSLGLLRVGDVLVVVGGPTLHLKLASAGGACWLSLRLTLSSSDASYSFSSSLQVELVGYSCVSLLVQLTPAVALYVSSSFFFLPFCCCCCVFVVVFDSSVAWQELVVRHVLTLSPPTTHPWPSPSSSSYDEDLKCCGA